MDLKLREGVLREEEGGVDLPVLGVGVLGMETEAGEMLFDPAVEKPGEVGLMR